MKPMEIFRRAVEEIGDVSAAELSAHLERQHSLKVAPVFIPLFRATLQDLDRTSKLHQAAKSEHATQPVPPA
jgi:hypothetical protein